MDIHNTFIAQEKNLVFYAGKGLSNVPFVFYYRDGSGYDFTGEGAIGYTFKIWEEREGGLQVADWSDPDEITEVGDILYLHVADPGIAIGKYYYEIEYIVSGGYPVLIGYGEAKFI